MCLPDHLALAALWGGVYLIQVLRATTRCWPQRGHFRSMVAVPPTQRRRSFEHMRQRTSAADTLNGAVDTLMVDTIPGPWSR